MMCAHPFMRDPHGVRWWVKMTDEERLAATPFPCGRCLPCRINRARIWVTRLMLEQRVHDQSCFITLTYSDDHLPPELEKIELQKFLKRLRKRVYPDKFRYFAVGEYGDKSNRPHYHLIIYGLGLIHEPLINLAWGKGYIMVGDLNMHTARYVTGYCIKKMQKKDDPRLNGRLPEFTTSSKKGGGIGYPAIKIVGDNLNKQKYWTKKDILRQLTINGKNMPLGRYLTLKLSEILNTSEKELKKELYDYQSTIFDTHMKPGESYYWNIVDENKGKRASIEAKQKIYKSRKSL